MRYEVRGPCDEVNNSPICPFIRIIPEPGGEVAVFYFVSRRLQSGLSPSPRLHCSAQITTARALTLN